MRAFRIGCSYIPLPCRWHPFPLWMMEVQLSDKCWRRRTWGEPLLRGGGLAGDFRNGYRESTCQWHCPSCWEGLAIRAPHPLLALGSVVDAEFPGPVGSPTWRAGLGRPRRVGGESFPLSLPAMSCLVPVSGQGGAWEAVGLLASEELGLSVQLPFPCEGGGGEFTLVVCSPDVRLPIRTSVGQRQTVLSK